MILDLRLYITILANSEDVLLPWLLCGSECRIGWLIFKETVESDEFTRRVEESGNYLRTEEKGLGFERDASFSGWCYEHDVTHTSQLDNDNVNQL